jgi:hypothetical protein
VNRVTVVEKPLSFIRAHQASFAPSAALAMYSTFRSSRSDARAARSDAHHPHEVLEHRAMLTLPDGTPFSEGVETYTGEVLAFPEPQ